ncbi:efflux RND transporter permease subunit, partial [Xanthomonas perforans]|uniref:efflux RND transporter permease subunit n=1 Tax=Xanthomonas perforans TaxID=442694 RepID=UPI001F17C851
PLTVATSGEIRTPEQLRAVLLSVPGAPAGAAREVTLGELAQVQVMPADPPQSAAVYQGQPAVVVSVSMQPGTNIAEFGKALRAKLDDTAHELPVGFTQ